MTDDTIPEVILAPGILADMEKDPELAEAMRDFSACARQAMQGVSDGRYASFEEAIEAVTGSRPEPVDLDDEYHCRGPFPSEAAAQACVDESEEPWAADAFVDERVPGEGWYIFVPADSEGGRWLDARREDADDE